MQRTYFGGTALATALGLMFVASAGCGKKDAGAPPPSAAATTALKSLPADADLVAGLSVAELRASPLWPRLRSSIDESTDALLTGMATRCKLDVLAELSSVVAGGPFGMAPDRSVLIARGLMTEQRVNECLQKMASEDGQELAISKEGAVTIYHDVGTGEEPTYVAWVEPSALLMLPGDPQNRAALEARLGAAQSAGDDAVLTALLGQVDTSATVWAIARVEGSAEAAQMVAQLPLPHAPTGAYLQLGLASGADLRAGIRFADAKQAQATADALQPLLGQAKMMLARFGPAASKLQLAARNTEVVITAKLSADELTQLLEAL